MSETPLLAPMLERADVVLIGAGIMSATLGVLLKELRPDLTIQMIETLDGPAQESSNAWNNAGTGHAALCELNYTPMHADGSVDITKALAVNTEFDLSRQFWAYLVKKGAIAAPGAFIHPVPHMSFVHGADNVAFLKKRHATLTAHHCYTGMEYSEDRARLRDWIPLVMEGRANDEPVAATHMDTGADVDYGALTRLLIAHLLKFDGVSISYATRATDIERGQDGAWRVEVEDNNSGERHEIVSKFVFLGAGGGALPLLQRSRIPEADGYAGFPVSGIWLRCDNEAVAARHNAKVYGLASVGSPPMSVPHLDARVIDGKRSLLFGPYAGFSTKFLKHGSLLDMFRSVRPDNIRPMLFVARDNFGLTEYLIKQVLETNAQRFAELQSFFPEADRSDWRQQVAGQRVQIIKRDPVHGGVLEFGTEIVASADRSLVSLLGASPGASTAAWIMLRVIDMCFKVEPQKLRQIIPSYGESLIDNAELCRRVRADTAAVLGLHDVSRAAAATAAG
jgi:malate dehydrogenase (quinone)